MDCATTEFKVFILGPRESDVVEFLNRYLGKWERMDNPEGASMMVMHPEDGGTFSLVTAQCAQYLFSRDETEARVYEFDAFQGKLRRINPETVWARVDAAL